MSGLIRQTGGQSFLGEIQEIKAQKKIKAKLNINLLEIS